MLSREEILERDDCPVRKVPTPEWGEGESVYVRTLDGLESSRFFEGHEEDSPNFLGVFAAEVISDQERNRIFKDEDAEELGQKNGAVLQRIVEAGLDLNGMSKTAEEKLVKNSEPGPPAG